MGHRRVAALLLSLSRLFLFALLRVAQTHTHPLTHPLASYDASQVVLRARRAEGKPPVQKNLDWTRVKPDAVRRLAGWLAGWLGQSRARVFLSVRPSMRPFVDPSLTGPALPLFPPLRSAARWVSAHP